VYPGGQGTRTRPHDQAQLDWVRQRRSEVPLMTRVGTDSLVCAAGLHRRSWAPDWVASRTEVWTADQLRASAMTAIVGG
jgi:putative intracellular protease/amidase